MSMSGAPSTTAVPAISPIDCASSMAAAGNPPSSIDTASTIDHARLIMETHPILPRREDHPFPADLLQFVVGSPGHPEHLDPALLFGLRGLFLYRDGRAVAFDVRRADDFQEQTVLGVI